MRDIGSHAEIASRVGPTSYTSPIDAHVFGEFSVTTTSAAMGDPITPARRFDGRITADGSSRFPAKPGRYHIYDVVSISYIDGMRDGRRWALRESTGPDPVNGFTLMSEAYPATEPGYRGAVSIPVLWGRHTHRIVSNDATTIDLDLATQFGSWSGAGIDTYPESLRREIDEVDSRLARVTTSSVGRAVFDTAVAEVVARLTWCRQIRCFDDLADMSWQFAAKDIGQSCLVEDPS